MLIAALCLATAATATIDVATLFWALLASPLWILVFKLHGLYDNDHRRIRHSTLDELGALVSACILGTLAIDGVLEISPAGSLSASSRDRPRRGGLLGCFVGARGCCAPSGTGWRAAAAVVIGPPPPVDMVARRVTTHPETQLALVGYLSPEASRAARAARLGSIDISGSPASRGSSGWWSPRRK